MTTQREMLDFEIGFFEKLIKEKSDFIDALIPLAAAYTRRGLYEKGLRIDRRLSRLLREDSTVHYNLACSLALLGKKKAAMTALRQAVRLGYADRRHLERDPDLKSLHDLPAFARLLRDLGKVGA